MKERIFGNRYKATGTMMSGGGGKVYICNDPNLDRKVAIKFLKPGIQKRRLLDEVSALQRIQSKNVVQVFDLVDDPTLRTGIVAEYLPGSDLTDPSVWPTDRMSFLRLAYQIANGVTDIHVAKVIHRDLKPNNLKFGDENILKIIDFNLARKDKHGNTVGFRGTHGFAAPEQYGIGPIEFTNKADVYSLAATLAYIALNGNLPDPLCEEPPNPVAWLPGFSDISIIDAELAILLNQALEFDPSKRPNVIDIRDITSRLLLRNKHRATITTRESRKVYEINVQNPVAQLSHPKDGGGFIEITYDGLSFTVTTVKGEVLVNHCRCEPNIRLPNSCVIDLESPTCMPSERRFVTFDLSHPEVVQ